MADDQNVSLTITAKNATEAAFKQVSAALKALEDATGQTQDKTKSLGDEITAYFTKNVDVFDLVKTGAIAAAAGIATATAAVVALGVRGATVADVANSFKILNEAIGNNADTMLGTLKRATAGTISDFALMKGLNLGMSEGMRLNAADADLLGKATRVLSDRIGIDNVTAYNTLIEAMATGRDRMLKQIGVSVDAVAAQTKYANSLGLTVNQLNKSQKVYATQQATLEALRHVLAVSGESQDDFADSVDRAKAAIENFSDDVAVGIAQSPVLAAGIDAAGKALGDAFGSNESDLVKDVVHWIEQATIVGVDFGIGIVSVANVVLTAWSVVKTAVLGVETIIVGVVSVIGDVIAALAQAATHIPKLGPYVEGFAEGANSISESLEQITTGLAVEGAEAAKGVAGHSALNQTLDKVGGTLFAIRDRMVDASKATDQNTETVKKGAGAYKYHGDAATTTVKALVDFQNKLLELNQALGANKKALTDDEFLKVYGSDLQKTWQGVEQFGIAWSKIPPQVQSALQRLTALQVNAMATVEASATAIPMTFKGVGEDVLAIGKSIDDEIMAANDKIVAANRATAKATRDDTFAAAQFAIDQAKRRGASEQVVFQMTTALSKQELDANIADREQQFRDDTKNLDLTVQANQDAYDAIRAQANADETKMTDDWKRGLEERRQALFSWSQGVKQILDGIPQLLQQAFTGGGGMAGFGKALESQIGGLLGKGAFEAGGIFNGLGNSLTKGMSKMFGDTIGDAFGMALPGIGGAVGSLIGPAIGKIGSAIAGLFNGGEGHKTNVERDNWIAQNFGTSDQLRQLAAQAGVADATMRQLFSTGKVKDFETVAKQVSDQIQGFTNDQTADQQRLNAAIQTYGFTIEELGPQMRQQNLDGQAQNLIEDWRVLAGSGIAVATVNSRMASTVQDYFNTAVKVGAEIPDAMKPILQSMVDQGVLVDANGNKITDLGSTGAQFSETMTQGFDKIVGKLQELIDKLNGAGAAIQNIPKNVDIKVNYNTDGSIPDLSQYQGTRPGEFVGTVPGAASGGIYSTPTFRVVAERQPEVVGSPNVIVDAFSQALKKQGGSSAVGGGMPDVIIINAQDGTARTGTYAEGRRITQMARDGLIRIPASAIVGGL